MNDRTSLILRMELIWWLVTAVVLALVLFPIYNVRPDYPFWFSNIIFVLVLITATRYLFLLKHTFLARAQWLKVAVIVGCLPLVLFLIRRLTGFNVYTEELGMMQMFDFLPEQKQVGMANYVQSEMRFFGAGSVVSVIALAFRLIVSYWRTHNRGTV